MLHIVNIIATLLAMANPIYASSFHLQDAELLNLRGQWNFYYHRLLTGSDLETARNASSIQYPYIQVRVPTNWNNYQLPDGSKFGPYGYGTFHTRVSGFQRGALYAIQLYFAGTAHRIYIANSGMPLCEAGQVSQDPVQYQPDYRHVFCRFYAPSEEIDITIQVANFIHAAGGLREEPIIGLERELWRHYLLKSTLIYAVLAFLFAASTLLILSFFVNQTEYRNLFMQGFIIALVLYILGTNIRLGREFWESYDFFIQARLHMFILPFGSACLLAYVLAVIKNRVLYLAGIILVSVLFLISIVYLFLSFESLMKLYFLNLKGTLLIAGILFSLMLYAVFKDGRKNWELMLGTVVVIVSVIIGLLRLLIFINWPLLELYGFLIFVLAETIRGITELNRTYQTHRKLLKENKAQIDKLVLLLPRRHLNKLSENWRKNITPGMYYRARTTIMLVRIEPFDIHHIDEQTLSELYYNLAEEIVCYALKEGGEVDRLSLGQFILSFEKDASQAINMAIFLRHRVRQCSEKMQHKFIYRCGIHHGEAVWGIYGSQQRWTGGFVGDTINTAARLENLCARYRTSVLVSQDAYFQASNADKYVTRMLEPVRLKGKKEHIFVYEVLDGLPEEILQTIRVTLPAFGRGLQAFVNQDFAHALLYFELVLAQNPEDQAAKLYLERTQNILNSLPDEEWNPIQALTQKSFA